MVKRCPRIPPRGCCAALALLLLLPLVVLPIGKGSLQWLQAPQFQHRRQRQQQQQPREQCGEQHGKGKGRQDGERTPSLAWVVLTAEATQVQAAAASDSRATDGGTAAAAENDNVDGASRTAEIHEEQPRPGAAAAGEQGQGIQGEAAPQQRQQQEAGGPSSAQGTGVTTGVPVSTVLPVPLPPASQLESTDGAQAAAVDATATVLPSRLSPAGPSGASVEEEAAAGSTGPAAVAAGAAGPRLAAEQRQQQQQSGVPERASASVDGGAAAHDSPVDAAAAGKGTPEEPGGAASHGRLLWTLLWPAAAFPVWLLGRVSWLLKVLAVVAAAVMQLAPLPTALRVRAQRTTGEVQGLPFLLLLFSASLWLAYGLLKLDLVLLLPNVTGVLLSCWYLHIFMRYCGRPAKDIDIGYSSSLDSSACRWDEAVEHMQQAARGRRQRTQIYCYGAGCLLVACSICVAAVAGLARPTHLVGLTAAVVNVLTYAAPLGALRRVLRTQSTACMPVEVSVGNWICSSLWLLYGWLSADLFILLPNLLGTIVGLLQVVLLMKFPPPSKRYFASVDGNVDDGCPSSHLYSPAAGLVCSPCAESSYLLAAAGAPARDVAPADSRDEFFPVGTSAAGAPELLPPTAAHVGGQMLAGSPLHADTASRRNRCAAGSASHCQSTQQTIGIAYRQQQASQTAHDFDTIKLTGGSSNSSSTNYGSSTCDGLGSSSIRASRLCSPSVNYGSSARSTSSTIYSSNSSLGSGSDCSGGSGVTCPAEDFRSNERPARHLSGTVHDEGYSRTYQPGFRNGGGVMNSNNGKPSVCGLNAPSLPTHEMLLRDSQQRLEEDESQSGALSTGCASVAAAAEGGGNFPA